MAPFKRMRTYQKFPANLTKSESAFNDLLAKNLTKRFECSLDRTTDQAETTFDRLLKTESYNPVILRKFPENKFTEDISITESTSLSNNRLQSSSISGSHNSDELIEPFERQQKSKTNQDLCRNIGTRSRNKATVDTHSSCDESQSFIKSRRLHHNHFIPKNRARKNCPKLVENHTKTSESSTFQIKKIKSKLSQTNEEKDSSFNPSYDDFYSFKPLEIICRSTEVTADEIDLRICNSENLEKSSPGNVEMGSELSKPYLNNVISTKNSQDSTFHNDCPTVDSSPDFKGFNSEQNKSTKKIHYDFLTLSLEMADTGTASSISIAKVSDVLEKTQNEPQENVYNNTKLASLILSRNEVNKYSPVLRKPRKHKNVSLAPNTEYEMKQLKTSKDSLNLTRDISSFLEYENSLRRHNIKSQLLISSTPLQSERKQNFPSITEDKENCTPIKKSYETINLWNYKCPSPSSFIIEKKLSISNKLVKIGRKKKWKKTNRMSEKNVVRSAIVRLERIPELDNILKMKKNDSSLNIRSLLLAISKNKNSSIVRPKRKKSKKKTQKAIVNRRELVDPIVLLTPLSKSNSMDETNEKREHICSIHCECFKKQPIVLLDKFDCFIQHSLIEKPQEAISIINISDSDSDSSIHEPTNHSIFALETSSVSKFLEEFHVSTKLDISDMGRSYTPTLKSQIDADNLMIDSSTEMANSRRNAYVIGSSPRINTENVMKDCHVLLNQINRGISVHSIPDLIDYSVSSERTLDNCKDLEGCDQGLERNSRVADESSECDIIESSIISPTITPKKKTKYINLAPGKKYRRSRVIWKIAKESLDISEQSGYDRQNSVRLNRRISVKLLPVRQEKNRISDLNLYASNSTGYGYVSTQEASLGDFENEFQNLFTSINTSNQSVHGAVISVTARDIVLRKCGQTEPLKFEKCYPSSILQNCQKIGEGVFGEVFLFREKDGSITVMKIIPIEGDQMVNMEKQKTFEEIISEIVISTELSNLRTTKYNNTNTFTEVKKIRCVEGCYPDRLLYLWELYDENKKSENDSPEIFNQNQLYIVLELSNGGCDLEAFEFSNGQQSLAVFKQVAAALAVAENEFQFEHRDLHWGNVLVTPTRENKTVFIIDGKEIEFDNKGVKATIIDFTLSRMEHEGVVIYNDLAMDEELFTAKGDYQFEIYRLMQKHNNNIWQNFKPYTNILWLHYMLDKIIDNLRYKNMKSRLHKDAIRTLKLYKNEILQYESVYDFVWNNFMK